MHSPFSAATHENPKNCMPLSDTHLFKSCVNVFNDEPEQLALYKSTLTVAAAQLLVNSAMALATVSMSGMNISSLKNSNRG